MMWLSWLLCLSVGRAEVGKITVAASVKSFDSKIVVVVVNRRNVRLPRELVPARDLKKGDAVLLTLRGSEIRYLLPPDNRLPASQLDSAPSQSR